MKNNIKGPDVINNTVPFQLYLGDMYGCGNLRFVYPSLLLPQIAIETTRFVPQFSTFFVDDADYYKPFAFTHFQRLSTKKHLEMIQGYKRTIRKQSKTFVFYETDDVLEDIPKWNQAATFYDKHDSALDIIKECDGMTVSTELLKEKYKDYNNNIIVRPNHLPKTLWGKVNNNREFREKRPRILWAGSSNHFTTSELNGRGITGGDFSNELIDFIKKTTKKYQWVIMGGYPLQLSQLIKQNKIEYHGFQPIHSYPAYVKSLNPDICIAPLDDNEFNRYKSNIKTLEYSVLGCPGVYSNVEPYKDMTIKTNISVEFISYIEQLADDVDLRKEIWKQDYSMVREQLFWEDNNYSNLIQWMKEYATLLKNSKW